MFFRRAGACLAVQIFIEYGRRVVAFWTSKRSSPHSGSEPFPTASLTAPEPDTNAPLGLERETLPASGRRSDSAGRAGAVCLLAAVCALVEAARYGASKSDVGLWGVSAALLLAARALPITRPRERPLTLMAPLAFALTCWFGPLPAGLGALVACLMYARLGTSEGNASGWSPQKERLLGARFLAACCAASWLMRGVGLPPITPEGLPPAASSVVRMMAGGLGGLAFVGCLALTYILLYAPQWNRDGRPASARRHLLRLGATMLAGVLPVMALAPVKSAFGAWAGLTILTALMLSLRLLRLHDEARELRGQLAVSEAMARASVHALESTDGLELLRRFLELSDGLVWSERSLVWVFHPENNVLTPDVARPAPGPFANLTVLYNEGVIGRAAALQKPRLVMDAGHAPQRLGFDREQGETPGVKMSGAWLLYPIVVRGQLLGVAQWTRPTGRPFTAGDIARLDALVPQAAIALENLYVRTQMQDLASHDGLTGLWNHKRMYELLREEIRRAARYHRALCVLMMDVDSFKTFNDTYGHPRGDDLLRVVANVLQNSVRNVDHVGRYGGEEFLIVLPETSKDAACHLAERIRAEIEANAFVVIGGQAIYRTLSIGVASYPEDAINPVELVEQADAALYRAKRSGKNRVHWA